MTTQTAADAIDRIPAGARIVAAPACGAPTTLLKALSSRADGRTWSLWTGLLFETTAVAAAIDRGELRHVTWHVSPGLRSLVTTGRVEHLPVRASQVPALIAHRDFDAALVRVTPPDRHGWSSLGPSASYAHEALASARLRIAEVDPTLPRTWGQSMVRFSDFDAVVDADEPMAAYQAASSDRVSDGIAHELIGLLPERPLLQIGIGAVPECFVQALGAHAVPNLRFVGMGCDGIVPLAELGLLDIRTDDGWPAISSPDLLGTAQLMQFADDNPSVGVYPSAVVHSPLVLARRDRLVSINTAVEVDLHGQVNAEVVGGRQISGVGGSLDFAEAATHSDGGMRIIALPSTTADGRRSRIVASLGEPATVTIPKAMVDFVVTEHGVAELRGRSASERAEALIAIAAPEHQSSLEAARSRKVVRAR